MAKLQVQEFLQLLKISGVDFEFELKTYSSAGDEDKQSSLINQSPDNFFTDQLDKALLNKEIDIAVHSAKDLPKELNENLSVFALTNSEDDTDCYVGKLPFSSLPKGARIGTSSIIRRNGLKKLNPNIVPVDIRGTIQERLQQLDSTKYDGIIVATIALKRLGLEDRIMEIMPWESTPLQGALAIVGRRNENEICRLFKNIDVRSNYGKVILVGAGPGDPDLITVKGIKALENCDCVFYDFLANKEILKYAKKAEKVYVGKRKGEHTIPQNDLSRMLKDKALEGKKVVRLKGGDPLVFGRGADEIDFLRLFHIEVDVVPGVSSATAICSRLGIPLTAREVSSSVSFVSGHSKQEDEIAHKPVNIPNTDTIVFFMGLTKLNIIVKSLKEKGWKNSTPIIVVSRGTWADENVVKGALDNIEEKLSNTPLKPPALIIVGKTVDYYREQYNADINVLYTGTNPQKYSAFKNLIHWPMIEVSRSSLPDAVNKDFIKQLNIYDMILLTSRFGVKYFAEIITENNIDLKSLKSKLWVVIGRDTADALAEFDIFPNLVSSVETSVGLFEEMKHVFSLTDKKILFPRSSLPNPYLKDHLLGLGAKVDEWVVYENKKPVKRDLSKVKIDQVIFTSPSTVKNFLDDYESIPPDWKIYAKGSYTKKILKEAGYNSGELKYA